MRASLCTLTVAAESAQLSLGSSGPACVFEDVILWWGGLRQYSLVFHTIYGGFILPEIAICFIISD